MAFDRSLRRAACALLTAALLVPAWGGLARQVRAAAQSEIDALKAEDFSPYYRLADKIRFVNIIVILVNQHFVVADTYRYTFFCLHNLAVFRMSSTLCDANVRIYAYKVYSILYI